MKNTRTTVQSMMIPVAIIVLAALMRLLPHPPNFAPIGGLALFSGALLDKKSRFIIPLTSMFISDIFLGFDSATPFVYASFILIILIGTWLKNNLRPERLILTSLLSSVLFFVITNFGVWAAGDMYAKNVSGLINSYTMGLPFFRNTVLSDLLYSFALFYGYRFITSLRFVNTHNLFGRMK